MSIKAVVEMLKGMYVMWFLVLLVLTGFRTLGDPSYLSWNKETDYAQ